MTINMPIRTNRFLDKILSAIDHSKNTAEKAKWQYDLGKAYEQGVKELPQRPDLAVIWYKKAHQGGHSHATYKLAESYTFGTLTKVDRTKAEELYKIFLTTPGSTQKHLMASYRLGRLLENTHLKDAMSYYSNASMEGAHQASYRLAEIHLREGNYVEALSYFELAQKQGNPQAASAYATTRMLALNSRLLENNSELITQEQIQENAAALGIPLEAVNTATQEASEETTNGSRTITHQYGLRRAPKGLGHADKTVETTRTRRASHP